jgi:uncharacterized C2H2 Zn-finger protein
LVILQDGKLISMATGLPYEGAAPATYKRAIANEEDELDEGVMRSMARRKKNAPPMDINQKCNHCDKVFKRPCDLTKHEKTHSRPWKCTDTTCKYHQIGWPTEKERDRHMNDKHAESPNTFRCEFEPCTYSSKRESNCKQHMEKAHGWVYIRSKHSSRSLGAKSKRGTSIQAPSVQATPNTPSVSTPTDFSTPSVGPTPSPLEASIDDDEENLNFNFADPPPQLDMGNAGFPTGFPLVTGPMVLNPTGYDHSIGTNHSAGVSSADFNHPTGYDNMTAYDNAAGFSNLAGVNYSTGFDHSAYQASSAGLTNDQVFSNFDMNLANLQAQFAAADPESLIAPMDMHGQSMSIQSAESVPDLGEYGSMSGTMSLDGSPQATADTSGVNFEFDWSSLDNLKMATDTEVGAYGHVSGLSPGAQGNLMLFSPDSGLSAGDISGTFPFGASMAPQPDFTLFEDGVANGQGLATGQMQGPFIDYD